MLRLSLNVKKRADKEGFRLYSAIEDKHYNSNYGEKSYINLVIRRGYQREGYNSSKELDFIRTFSYEKERSVKITDTLIFDITTGDYDGRWGEDVVSIDKYFEILNKSI